MSRFHIYAVKFEHNALQAHAKTLERVVPVETNEKVTYWFHMCICDGVLLWHIHLLLYVSRHIFFLAQKV